MRKNIKIAKLKTLFSRLLAITLAITTAITTIPPTEIYAETQNTGGNTGGGDSTTSSTTNKMAWYRQTRGYRIYVVNQNLERISPVYDFYNKAPEYIYPDAYAYKKETRFDEGAPAEILTEHHPDTINVLREWCSPVDEAGNIISWVAEVPLPTSESKPYVGQGDEFKEWFFAGADGFSRPSGESSGVTEINKDDGSGGGTGGGTIFDPPVEKYNCFFCKGTGYEVLKCESCNGTGKCGICHIIKAPIHADDPHFIVDADHEFECSGKCQYCRGTTSIGKQTCRNRLCPYRDSAEETGTIETKQYCSHCDRELLDNNTCPTCKNCLGCGEWLCTEYPEDYDIEDMYHTECYKEAKLTICSKCKKEMEKLEESTYICRNCDILREISGENKVEYSKSTFFPGVSVFDASTQNYLKKYNAMATIVPATAQYGSSFEDTVQNYVSYAYKKIETEFIDNQSQIHGYSPELSLKYAQAKTYEYFAEYLRDILNLGSNTQVYYQVAVDIVFRAAQQFTESATYEAAFYKNLIHKDDLNMHAFNTNLLFNLIPLAGSDGEEVETGEAKSPADNLITKTNAIKVVGSNSITGDPYVTVKDALNDGCLLIVEPLTGMYARVTYNDDYSDTRYWSEKRIYGSYWNIVQEWKATGQGGFYGSLITSLYPYCMITTKDIELKSPVDGSVTAILAGVDMADSIKPLDAKELMKTKVVDGVKTISGLAMHAYDATVATSTYDEPLAEQIGPSPDDTARVPEYNREDKTKYANIVKFYEEINAGTGEVIESTHFVREKVPRTIYIETEELTGYTLMECVAAGEFFNEEDLEVYNYETVTNAFTLEYTPFVAEVVDGRLPYYTLFDNETTLYVRYVKDAVSTKTYDPVLADNPGPSPDDTYKLSEEQLADPTKYANIVKFYETIDESTGEIIEQQMFVREQVPQTIKLIDESELTKYVMEDWFTTTTLYPDLAPIEEGDTDSEYEFIKEYHEITDSVCRTREENGEELDTTSFYPTITLTTHESEEEGADADAGASQVETTLYIKLTQTIHTNETTTYNHAINSSLPHPAPSLSPDYPDELLPEIPTTIIKIYNHIYYPDPSNPTLTEQESVAFVTNNTLRTILIEDESNISTQTHWDNSPDSPENKLKVWFTSQVNLSQVSQSHLETHKDKAEIPPMDWLDLTNWQATTDPSTLLTESYVKSLLNPAYIQRTGKRETKLTLTPTETTLYVIVI